MKFLPFKRTITVILNLAAILTTPLALEAFCKKVCISQIVEHPALNQTRQGIIDTLRQEGYVEGKNLEIYYECAQGNPVLAQQIAAKFISLKPDIAVGIATLSAQSLAKAARLGQIKLVFSSVTDPLGAGLVESLDKPGYAISGVSNFIPLEPQLKFYRALLPNLTKLGFLYNPAEANSVKLIGMLETLCPTFGMTLVAQALMRTNDAAQSATSLATRCNAIFISNDNTSLSALPTIINTSRKLKIPVLVSDTDALELGALAALGPNQYAVGMQTGQMIVRVLRGEALESMPMEFPTSTQACINAQVAQALAIEIPESLRSDPNVEILTEKSNS